MKKEEIDQALKDTFIGESIKTIESIYAITNEKTDEFCNHYNIHCKKNCGECCEHFEPTITELEAIYLAYGAIINDRVEEMSELLMHRLGHCPLYHNEKHCLVYPYRPLLCRLFNSCASRMKDGKAGYRYCKYDPRPQAFDNETFVKDDSKVVTMEEFGQMIEGQTAGENQEELLSIAFEKALNKVRFFLSMRGIDC